MADNVNVTEGSGKTIAGDEIAGVIHQRVKLTIGSEGVNEGDVSSSTPLPAYLTAAADVNPQVSYNSGVTGNLTQRFVHATDVGTSVNITEGTLPTVTRVSNIVDGTLTTVTFVPTVQRVQNIVDGTLTTVTGVDRVRNIVDGTITTVTGITNTVRVQAGDGTFSVRFSPSTPNVAILSNAQPIGGSGVVGSTTQRVVHAVDVVQSMNIMAIGTTNTLGVYLSATAGTLNVALKPGAILTNAGHTAQIFTVSGSTSGGTTSGVTLISPSANYNFKVFAYSLQTTAIAANVWRFANGSGASQTEFWRPLVISSETTSTPKGANLAVPPPSYLFATGVSTTLVLHSDAGSLVHYSVSYIKESA